MTIINIASTSYHVKIIQGDGDKGVYDAFNKAVPFSKGKYILSLILMINSHAQMKMN